MVNTTFTLDSRSLVCLVGVAATLGAAACSGADHLTEPLVSVGGNYLDSIGITPRNTSAGGSSSASGGANGSQTGGVANALGGANSSQSGGVANATGGANSSQSGGNTGTVTSTAFDWGTSSYDSNGGATIAYQTGHFAGMSCMVSCHAHTMTLGGTAYQSDGTTAAANAQLGFLVNGNLTTTYSGSAGNFFVTISGSVDWATAQIAIRTSTGTTTMPVNASASGNCNSCHDSTNRILIP